MRMLLVISAAIAILAFGSTLLSAQAPSETCQLLVSLEPQLVNERDLAENWSVDFQFSRESAEKYQGLTIIGEQLSFTGSPSVRNLGIFSNSENVEFKVELSGSHAFRDLYSIESGEFEIPCSHEPYSIFAVEEEFEMDFEEELANGVIGYANWRIEIELIAIPVTN